MKTIAGQNNYIIEVDQSGTPIAGSYIDENTSAITNNTSLKTNDLTTKQVDWAINDAANNGISGDVLILESEPRSILSDQAVEKLINEGKTVITIAP